MALSDDTVQFSTLLNARNPSIALTNGGQATSLALAILSVANQINDLIRAGVNFISVNTATGSALDGLAANYGKVRNTGVQAVAPLQCSIPAAVLTTTVVNTGFVAQVPGLGSTQPPIPFVTAQDMIIPIGSTTSNVVAAQAQNAGVSGNVAANQITGILTDIEGGLSVTNPHAVDGTVYSGIQTVLGVDAEDDSDLLGDIQPQLKQKYGAEQIQAVVANVPGVYDAYVVASGTPGTINIYWCAVDGTQPAGTQTLVDLAVRGVLFVSFIPAYPTFTITQITTLAITYSAPTAIQSAAIEPLIQQAVVDWIQSNKLITPQTVGLRHGGTIVVLTMGAYVQNKLNNVLTDFKVTSSIPAAATTTVYRINAGVSAVVLTRV